MKKLVLVFCSTLLILNVNAQVKNIDQYIDSLMHKDYLTYLETNKGTRNWEALTENQWRTHTEKNYETQLLFPEAPGSYLIKGKNQMFTGMMFFFLSGACFYASSNFPYETVENGLLIAGSAFAVSGAVFEIIGIEKIGKAGVLLNKNGIGISIKF